MKIIPAMLRTLSAALLLIAPAVEARQSAAPPQTRVATPAIWQVRDADTTIYLFGTIHVMKPGIDWFGGKVRQAFDASDELMLEIVEPDDPNVMGNIMAQAAIASDGIKLSDRLTDEARGKYTAAMTGNGLPVAAFDMFNPWMAGMALSVAPLARMGYQSDLGAEKVLQTAAQSAGKSVGALETVEQQIGFFAGLPMDQQVTFLNATVDGLPDMEAEFDKLMTYWAEGKPDNLADSMNESLKKTPELAQVLLIGRNANWARWIKDRMSRPGTVFIAVGAGHLAGKGSVQEQLHDIGIDASRIED